MSEPNTSEPLHSSCTRQVILVVGSVSLVGVAEHIDGDAADRRQEHLKVRARHEFGKHAGGLFEQNAAQRIFRCIETFGDTGQIPTGSTAILVTPTLPLAWTMSLSTLMRPARILRPAFRADRAGPW